MINENSAIQMIEVDSLTFDPDNPRLPSDISGDNESQVIEWMLKDASLGELMGSIGEHGYFYGEPLLVVPNGNKFIVVEGNRRLGALKLLANPELAPKRRQTSIREIIRTARVQTTEVPSVIFPERNSILDYLGYRHITGIKTWGALAKAKYLAQLYPRTESHDIQEKLRELAKKIGSRADYVARLLAGLELYNQIVENDFFGIKDLDEDSISFSVLTTALSYSSIVSYLGLKSATDTSLVGLKVESLRDLTSWIFEKNSEGVTRLGESRNLRTLSAVVENEKALSVFKGGLPLLDASLYTEEPIIAFRQSIINARNNLDASRNTVHLVDKPLKSDADILEEISKMSKDLRTLVIQRLQDED